MFKKILIANRGEIACRIVRTCKRLGISTVGIASEVERGHPHTVVVDRCVTLGKELRDSYLDPERIIQVALDSGVEAIHPGYGFLSENAEFADSVTDAGLVFIGPDADTMRLFGQKHTARRVAVEAGVPVSPGYDGDDLSLERLELEAVRVGFPLMIKAVSGGGGRGMRLVHELSELKDALESASREAKSSFSDGRVLIERFIPAARHIEVQLLGDGRGTVLHFYERDCSVQRRYQKIIEEAPAPALPLRDEICKAAVRLGERVKLKNACTAEFLVTQDEALPFIFLEANTRLQVEHPVTEEITGYDLVELQLLAASGEPLGVLQDDIRCRGSALELRIYAENPAQDFMPTAGVIESLAVPSEARVESGVAPGVQISTAFDPMLMKIITSGRDRPAAIAHALSALRSLKISGVETNISYLEFLLQEPSFVDGAVTTKYCDGVTFEPPSAEPALALCAFLFPKEFLSTSHGWNPFHAPSFFRSWGAGRREDIPLFGPPLNYRVVDVLTGKESILKGTVSTSSTVETPVLRFLIEGEEFLARRIGDGAIEINRRRLSIWNSTRDGGMLSLDGRSYHISELIETNRSGASTQGEELISSPLPGSILQILCAEGATVSQGDPLFILESMKMEHRVSAPSDGVVSKIYVGKGEGVRAKDRLASISAV